MLSLSEVKVYYGRAQVLFGLSFEVARGEVVALMGRNGAGKSTTLKTVMGIVEPSAGEIRFDGVDIAGRAAHEIAGLGIGYVPEDRRIFTELTVAENLETGRQPPRDDAPQWTPSQLFELFPNLAGMRHRRAARTSGGEQQMLALARTLMGNPRLLLLDEPSEGLAPVIVEQLVTTIKELKDEGLTVLLSEQNLRFAGAVADRALVIEKGRLVHSGPMDDFLGDEELRRQYLAV
ncbi:MAG: ABC transporter ATP-binding protein [Rhodovibrionaceae bacterium]|nr:ABC transporter ATP-binding protein [Rhodovibrionaceae bacterium]